MLRRVKRCWKRKLKLVMVVVAAMMLRCGGGLNAGASMQKSQPPKEQKPQPAAAVQVLVCPALQSALGAKEDTRRVAAVLTQLRACVRSVYFQNISEMVRSFLFVFVFLK